MSYLDNPKGVPFCVVRSGSKSGPEFVWRMRCPKCGQVTDLDDDQMNGRVSTQCACGFHETVRWVDCMPGATLP